MATITYRVTYRKRDDGSIFGIVANRGRAWTFDAEPDGYNWPTAEARRAVERMFRVEPGRLTVTEAPKVSPLPLWDVYPHILVMAQA